MAEAKIVLSAEDRTRAAFESVKGGLNQVSSLAASAGFSLAALGSAATVAGLVSMVRSVAQGVDAMNDLKDATGASIENISALESVAKRTGGNFDTVSTSLIKFNMALGQTIKPGSDAEKVLEAIGLNAKNLRDLDPAEALLQTAKALNAFADDGNKARAVQELFGKSLKEVAPFLKDLAEKGELVATVTTKQAEEAEKFNKELYKMSAASQDAARSIAGPLVTGVNTLIERFRSGAREGDNFLTTIIRLGAYSIPSLVAKAGSALLGIGGSSTPTYNADDSNDAMSRRMGRRTSINIPVDAPAAKKSAAVKVTKELTEAEKDLAYHVEYSRKAELARHDDRMKAHAQELKATEDSIKAWAEAEKAREEADVQAIAAIHDRATAINDEVANYGKLQSAIEQTKLAKLEEARDSARLTGEDVDALERRIAAQKRLVEAIKGKELNDANVEAAAEASKAWEKVGDSFVDNLMRGGKSVAQYLKDLFRTLVLRPLLAPIGNAMSSMVSSVMGGGGGAAGGGFNPSSLISGATSLYTAGSYLASGASGSMVGAAAGMGATLPGSAVGIGAMAGGTGAAGTFGAIGSALGAIPVWGWAAMAALAIFTLTKSKGGPKNEMGEGFGINGTNGRDWNDPAARSITDGIEKGFAQVATELGITSKFQAGVFVSKDPKGNSLTQLDVRAGVNGREVYSRGSRGSIENVGREDKDVEAALVEETIRAIFAAVKESDLATKYKDILNAVVADAGVPEMEAALTRVRSVKAEEMSLEEQLYQLTATAAQKLTRTRERERAAVDPLNAALLEQVYAQQDLLTATEAATAAAIEKAAKESAIASQRESLEVQLLRLQGNIVEIRKRELAQIDPSNHALQERIWALEDEQEALSKVKTAAEAMNDALNAAGAASDAWYAGQLEITRQAEDQRQALAKAMMDSGRSISEYIKSLTTTRMGTQSPEALLRATRNNYISDLSLSKAGDMEASNRITGSAQSYMEAQKGYTASGSETQAVISQVISELGALPQVQSYEAQTASNTAKLLEVQQQNNVLIEALINVTAQGATQTIEQVQQVVENTSTVSNSLVLSYSAAPL